MFWIVQNMVDVVPSEKVIIDYVKWGLKIIIFNLISVLLQQIKTVVVSFSLKVIALLVCKSCTRSWVLTHRHIDTLSLQASSLSTKKWIIVQTSPRLIVQILQLLLVCFGDHFNSIKILLSLLLCNTLQQPKFSRLSCKLHIVWTFLWIQNWKPMQILQLFQPLDWPPHERSFCCLCHLCHNHSFNSPCHQSGFYDY